MSADERHRRRPLLIAGALAAVAIVVVIAVATGGGGKSRSSSTSSTASTSSATSPSPSAPATGEAPLGPPAQPAPAGHEYGANVDWLFRPHEYSRGQVGAQLEQLRRTGAMLARADTVWEASEPAPPVAGVHHYDWTVDDWIAKALATHGLRWLPVIDYTAPWAQSIPGKNVSPPRSAADYAAYAGAFAARYGDNGSFWSTHPTIPPDPVDTIEIWNEPDTPQFWDPKPDPAAYADMYLRARDAITASDPSVRVIIGGLAHPAQFMRALLGARRQMAAHVDGVGIHPYGPNPLAILASIRADRELLRSVGLAETPLYVTEFGWATNPVGTLDYLPERLRPTYISSTLAAIGHTDCGVAATLIYTWITPRRDPATGEEWFGIQSPTEGPSPDTAAFTSSVRRASAPSPPLRLCSRAR